MTLTIGQFFGGFAALLVAFFCIFVAPAIWSGEVEEGKRRAAFWRWLVRPRD